MSSTVIWLLIQTTPTPLLIIKQVIDVCCCCCSFVCVLFFLAVPDFSLLYGVDESCLPDVNFSLLNLNGRKRHNDVFCPHGAAALPAHTLLALDLIQPWKIPLTFYKSPVERVKWHPHIVEEIYHSDGAQCKDFQLWGAGSKTERRGGGGGGGGENEMKWNEMKWRRKKEE